MDELDHVIVHQIVGGMLPIIYYGVYHLCYYLLLFMLDTLGPGAMISDLNHLCFHDVFVFLILSTSCMHLL